ncbi:MAG: hypothetical protein ABFS28_10185 [Bacteroidota bacterium]
MRKRRNQIQGALILLLLGSITQLAAQSELKTRFELGGGGEYNIFKSPESLYSNVTGEYWGMDSLIISDVMADAAFDLGYSKEKKDKYMLNLGSDLWYRYYMNTDELSQAILRVTGDYTRILSRKFHMGALYTLRWSDRVGTSVTGDLLMRSFKYLGNKGMFYLDFLPSRSLAMRLFSNYQYKIYYDERTLDPLDHGNLEVNYSLNINPVREHEVRLELSFLDRQYSQYHALDADGKYERSNPLRHFRYYEAVLDYNWKPVRGFRINPEMTIKRRFDLFEDYYSYFSYGGGLRLRYMWSKFYVSLYGDYRRVAYDVREAFTSDPDDPLLIYGYLDYSLLFKYDLSNQWELYISASSDHRDSNTDLDTFKTRRGYKNYEALIGITYSLPTMKWK